MRPPRAAPEVLSIGESMALFAPVEGGINEGSVFTLASAGAEANVAQYLADLGHRTAWFSRVGADPFGTVVRNAVSATGVCTDYVILDEDAPTGVFFKDPSPDGTAVHYYRSGSAASRLSPRDLSLLPWEDTRVLHQSGITPALSESCAELTSQAFARAAEAQVIRSFDINYRPRLWSVKDAAPVLLELAGEADIVFVGRDEAQNLWGTGEPSSIRSLLGTGHSLVIKDADVGATHFEPGSVAGIFSPTPPVTVVEQVGAGDAFAAGYLSGLLNGLDPVERLELGHKVAALALSSTRDHVDATGLRLSMRASQ